MKNFKCPCCNGDGQETCSNPDHGFLGVFGSLRGNANESACPACGHDENHKIWKYENGKRVASKCYECSGEGRVSQSECERLLDEYGMDCPIDDYELFD